VAIGSERDRFNNEERKGLWARLSHAVETGDMAVIRRCVPKFIKREQVRVAPMLRSHGKTLYDIARYVLGRSQARGLIVGSLRSRRKLYRILNPAGAIVPAPSAPVPGSLVRESSVSCECVW